MEPAKPVTKPNNKVFLQVSRQLSASYS